MAPERTPGGWEAAIDAGLAARLLRPAVRPGITDPGHGRAIAARLQRATPPTLADDVARRYGSATLGGNRPPIVYAAPRERPAATPTAASTASAESAASAKSAETVAQASGWPVAAATVADAAGVSPTTLARAGAARPVVRAGERTTGPAFPPVRPLGAGPVQRRTDPAAAEAPVVAARRPVSDRPGPATGPSHDAGVREGALPALPLVSPAPTQLRRQLAAEHAEAAAPAQALPLVRASRSDPATAHADERMCATVGPAEVVAPAVSADGGSPAIPTSAAPLTLASPPAAVVQRFAGPGAEHAEAVTPAQTLPLVRASRSDPAVARAQVRMGATASPAEIVAPDVSADGGSPAIPASAAPLTLASPPAAVVQRVADPGSPLPPAGERRAEAREAAPSPVVAPTARGDAASAAERTYVSPPAAASAAALHGGRRAPAGRPVVAPRSGGTGTVQRLMFGGAGALLTHAASALGRSATSGRARPPAAAAPPAGAPPAELPTATAEDARRAAGADTEAIAGQVYEILVRRLESERRQRGW